jgi:hypothetical protein
VMVASRPKVSFWPDGSTSHGNYGWLFVLSIVPWVSPLLRTIKYNYCMKWVP